MMYHTKIRNKKDFLGAACSGLCIIHCLGLPILATTSVSLTGLAYLSGESTHLWLNVAMLIIALWAFPAGWRIHKMILPSLLAFTGTGLMAIAVIVPENNEIYWVISSGVSFISGHLLNRYFVTQSNIK
jgi:hypothetical protein